MSSPLDALQPEGMMGNTKVDITVIEEEKHDHHKRFAGHRNKAALWWILWVFLAPVVIYVIFESFPFSQLKVQDPTTGQCVLDRRRLFGFSILVGWILVLIFWICSWCAY